MTCSTLEEKAAVGVGWRREGRRGNLFCFLSSSFPPSLPPPSPSLTPFPHSFPPSTSYLGFISGFIGGGALSSFEGGDEFAVLFTPPWMKVRLTVCVCGVPDIGKRGRGRGTGEGERDRGDGTIQRCSLLYFVIYFITIFIIFL